MNLPSLYLRNSYRASGPILLGCLFLLVSCRPRIPLNDIMQPDMNTGQQTVPDLYYVPVDLNLAADLRLTSDQGAPADLATPSDLTIPIDGDPTVTLASFGSPTWRPVGCQLISTIVGRKNAGSPEAFAFLESILPNHKYQAVDNLLGPKSPHNPSYDGEYEAGLTALGIKSHRVFMASDWVAPRAIMFMCMIVPITGAAAVGSSPDFASGPILLNNLFRMPSSGYLYRGVSYVGVNFVGNWPPLTGLFLPLPQDGWSHLPFNWWANTDYRADLGAGNYEYQFKATDALGNGWTIAVTFTVI